MIPSTPDPIPFLDLENPHRELEAELTAVFARVLRSGRYIGGPVVEEFESAFARFCDAKHAVSVNSGTDALRFALVASGVRQGDIVITVPHTFIATTEAISQAGALPEFVDIDEKTYTMSAAALAGYAEHRCSFSKEGRELRHRASGRRVAAVIPVHLYGQMADMDPILDLASRYGLTVIEDACQAHGASYYSQARQTRFKAGSLGRAAAFSFYPGKNLGALGEGGAVTTDDDAIAASVRMLRDHGQARKYYHDIEGYNGRLDAVQAGLLSAKLRYLDDWNSNRRDRARFYNELFAGVDRVITPFEPEWSRAVYHLYVIRVGERDLLQKHLADRGIGTGLHYPVPLHLQKAYSGRNFREGDFPVCERIAREILSLPMFPGLSESAQRRVAGAVTEFVSAR